MELDKGIGKSGEKRVLTLQGVLCPLGPKTPLVKLVAYLPFLFPVPFGSYTLEGKNSLSYAFTYPPI